MPQAKRSNRPYWTLHSIGWSLYFAVNFASLVAFNYTNTSIPVIAAISLFGAIQLGTLTHLLRLYSKRKNWLRLSYAKLVPRLLAATLFLATLSQLFVSVVAVWVLRIFPIEQYSFFYLGINIFQAGIWIALWTLIYFCVQFFRNHKDAEIEKWRLQAAVNNAELIALKAQVNPHFIFNCLNNIRALVLEDPEKSREAITKLSDLLRNSIEINKAEKVTIASELAMVRDYLSLERIHMENRLQFSITCDSDLETFEIPPMSIQLLVENAIKHSLANLPNGGSIEVEIQKSDTFVTIKTTNTGQLIEQKSTSTGIGLKNIRERLTLLYGESADCTLENLPGNHVQATLSIPLEGAK